METTIDKMDDSILYYKNSNLSDSSTNCCYMSMKKLLTIRQTANNYILLAPTGHIRGHVIFIFYFCKC